MHTAKLIIATAHRHLNTNTVAPLATVIVSDTAVSIVNEPVWDDYGPEHGQHAVNPVIAAHLAAHRHTNAPDGVVLVTQGYLYDSEQDRNVPGRIVTVMRTTAAGHPDVTVAPAINETLADPERYIPCPGVPWTRLSGFLADLAPTP